MSTCKFCGATLPDNATICPQCGAPHEPVSSNIISAEDDRPSVGLNILSFLVPIVGIILYFATKGQYPIKAKANLKWAIISIVICAILGFIGGILEEL